MTSKSRFLKNKAFVLASYPSGEADRMLILLTEDFGKIKTMIKGIRKSKKREKIATEPLSFVEFSFYKKGDNFIIIDFSSIEIFIELRRNLNTLGISLYILDVVNKFIFEGYRVFRVFILLKNSLYYLNREENLKKQLILVLYFLLRMIKEEGILEVNFLEEKFIEEEREILMLMLKKKIKIIQEEEQYTIQKILAMVKKIEYFVSDKLDTKINIEDYILGGELS